MTRRSRHRIFFMRRPYSTPGTPVPARIAADLDESFDVTTYDGVVIGASIHNAKAIASRRGASHQRNADVMNVLVG